VAVRQGNLECIIEIVGIHSEASETLCLVSPCDDELLVNCDVHSVQSFAVVQQVDIAQVHLYVHDGKLRLLQKSSINHLQGPRSRRIVEDEHIYVRIQAMS